MRVPGLQIVRVVEVQVDVATARTICGEHRSSTVLSGEISLVHFVPSLVPAVVIAQSPRRGREFLRFAAEGESGWLAIDRFGQVIGYVWRLDNRGRSIIRRRVSISCGWSWFHHGWTAPTWREQGIGTALLCRSMSDALAQPTWPVQGFVTDVAAANHASQRSSARAGFRPVRLVTSLRIGPRWLLLHSELVTKS